MAALQSSEPMSPSLEAWSPSLMQAGAEGAQFSQRQRRLGPYLPQPLTQLGGQLELLGVAQALKGQLWLLALQISLGQFQVLHLLLPGGERENRVPMEW